MYQHNQKTVKFDLNDLETLKEQVKKELKSLKEEVEYDSKIVEKELKNRLTNYELKYFSNSLKPPLQAELIVRLKDFSIEDIKTFVKIVKEALNEIGYKFVVFNFKRRLKKLIIIIDF